MLSFSPISTMEFQSGDRLRTSIKILILDCAARIICGNHDFINVRGGDLVKEPRLQSIETRRNYFTAMLMFKIRNEIAPQRLLDILFTPKILMRLQPGHPGIVLFKFQTLIMNSIETYLSIKAQSYGLLYTPSSNEPKISRSLKDYVRKLF